MIAQWILYCVAVGTALGLGAAALERALRACALPVRWAWLGAMLLTLAIPAAVRVLPREAPPAPPRVRVAAPAGVAAPPPADGLPLRGRAPRRVDLARLDRPLLLAWGAASAAVLLGLLSMSALLRRRRARWRAAELAGVPVLVSPDTGPAVVGLFRSRIVLPEWAAGADPGRRGLLLEHEMEHLRAGDPRLLAAGLAALVLVPWNPAVWWQLRRLRLAVEIDCDARVLRRGGDVRAYGSLLLEVGRRAAGSPLAAAAFSEPTSFLERRIRIMTLPRERSPWLRAAGFGALALGLVAAACETPAPTSIAAAPAERVYSAADAREGLLPAKVGPRDAIARHHPDVLTRGMGGNDHVVLVVDHRGEIVRSTLGKSGSFVAPRAPAPERAPAAAPAGEGVRVRVDEGSRSGLRVGSLDGIGVAPERIETVDVMKFQAGEMGPDPVGVIWVQLRDPAAPPPPARVREAPRAAGDADADLTVSFEDEAGVVLRRRAADGEERGGPVRVREGSVTVGEGPGVDPVDPATVVQAVERHHPEVARGQSAPEHLWFVADAAGRVVRTGTDRDMDHLSEYGPDRLLAVDSFERDRIQVNGRGVSVIWVRLRA